MNTCMYVSYSEAFTQQDSDEDDSMVGPPLPPEMLEANKTKSSTKDNKDSDDEESDSETEDLDDDNPVKKIPSSHEIVLNHGDRTVSALTLDPSGARLCTGGVDYEVKFWDFAGMDSSLRAFRHIKPCER